MWFSRIRLKDINSFSDTGNITLSKNINVLIGQNNSGKSTLINTLLILQDQNQANLSIRIGAANGLVEIRPEEVPETSNNPIYDKRATYPVIAIDIDSTNRLVKSYQPFSLRTNTNGSNTRHQFENFSTTEPNNIIYPFLSRRKVTHYNEAINSKSTQSVTGTFENLYAKIDRLCNRFHSGHDTYYDVTTEVFGYPISVVETESGKKAAYVVNKTEHIPMTLMGEGVPNLLAFIVDMCLAKDKIFLIEEPENDIHPKVLKSLLKLIQKTSETNQFIISTHSNIVLKELGLLDTTKILQVKMSIDDDSRVPNSTVQEIGTSKLERLQVLEDLGYEFQDFDLWQAWLFLEESSAEQLIREYFIKWFNPNLTGKLKTFSARSKDEVIPKFKNFNDLFVFLHLEPTYKDRAWVIIDGGDDEKKIIDSMKDMYVEKNGWTDSRFRQLTEHNFEKYYPKEFKSEDNIQSVLDIADKQERREAKKKLLEDLLTWISVNEETAKKAFATSAKEVIDILNEIEEELGA